MDLKEKVSARLRAIRKSRGLTQQQVADLIDRSPEAVSMLERGHNLPSLETLDRLATALDLPLYEFLRFSEIEQHASANEIRRVEEVMALAHDLREDDLEIVQALLRLMQERGARLGEQGGRD